MWLCVISFLCAAQFAAGADHPAQSYASVEPKLFRQSVMAWQAALSHDRCVLLLRHKQCREQPDDSCPALRDIKKRYAFVKSTLAFLNSDPLDCKDVAVEAAARCWAEHPPTQVTQTYPITCIAKRLLEAGVDSLSADQLIEKHSRFMVKVALSHRRCQLIAQRERCRARRVSPCVPDEDFELELLIQSRLLNLTNIEPLDCASPTMRYVASCGHTSAEVRAVDLAFTCIERRLSRAL